MIQNTCFRSFDVFPYKSVVFIDVLVCGKNVFEVNEKVHGAIWS